MVHHPLILGPKLVVLAVIIIVLIVLHGVLPPEQFRIAVILSIAAFVCFAVAIWVIVLRMLRNPNSKLAKALILSRQERADDASAAPSRQSGVTAGARGKAVSELRPSGVAAIDGKRVSVVTSGEFIPAGAGLEVVAVKGYNVVVKELADQQQPEHT